MDSCRVVTARQFERATLNLALWNVLLDWHINRAQLYDTALRLTSNFQLFVLPPGSHATSEKAGLRGQEDIEADKRHLMNGR